MPKKIKIIRANREVREKTSKSGALEKTWFESIPPELLEEMRAFIREEIDDNTPPQTFH
jgi:hypothetical protein